MGRVGRLGVLALVLWSGCGGNPTQPSPLALGKSFELRPGERAAVADGISLLFVDVPSDSRCPIDAMCVSGGEALADVMFMIRSEPPSTPAAGVRLYVNGVPVIDGQLATVPWCVGDFGRWECRLSTDADKSIARAREFTIRLVDLKPQRRAATSIARGDYVGTFVIAAQ